MMTFDRGFARLLLEICRYTYTASFDDRINAGDKQDALNWIKSVGGLLTDEPIILRGSKTSVACIAAYPDRNIVAYMGTKTQFNTLDNAVASVSIPADGNFPLVFVAVDNKTVGSQPYIPLVECHNQWPPEDPASRAAWGCPGGTPRPAISLGALESRFCISTPELP